MDEPTTSPKTESHRYLSAPWRMRYLSKNTITPDCVFCEKLSSTSDIDNLVVWRGDSTAIVMNLYPYTTGHLMLMPYEHVASPEELREPEVLNELIQELPFAMRAVRNVLRCQGFNTGMNTGHVAGAGIADHMHMHLVPRWSGDASFMPIIANATVMPEALSITYAKLRAEFTVQHHELPALRTLVFSPDHCKVFIPGDLPANTVDDERSSIVIIQNVLNEQGIEATVAGWTGNDTIVWQATRESTPAAGEWKSIASLPDRMRSLVEDALARLPSATD